MPNNEARTPVTPQQIRNYASTIKEFTTFHAMWQEMYRLADQLERNAEAAAWMYQYAGATGAPQWALDNLSALASGKPAPHKWAYPAVPHDQLERNAEDADKVKAFNLLLTAVNPMVKQIAERYLEGVKDYDAFVEYLRKQPKPRPLQDADIDEDCR